MRPHTFRAAAAGALAVGLLAFAISPAQATVDGQQTETADAISDAIENADQQPGTETAVPAPDADPTKGTTVVSDGVVASAPADAGGTLSVTSRYDGDAVGVTLPVDVADDAVVSDSGAVTYAGDDVSVGVRVFDSGVQISTVIDDAAAAHSFSYEVDLPADARIEPTPDGGVLFVGSDGAPLGGFAAPWAADATGTDVPTSYQIDGHTVVQLVDAPADAAYPVVADPYLWVDLISSARWVSHSGYGWTMEVSPTGWARAQAGSYLVGTYGWNELYSKYKNRGLNTNLDGMRDQFICHQQVVAVVSPTKKTWNLDEWRANVSYAATVNAQCNPGGSKIFD